MANTLTAAKPTYWSKRYQAHLRARNIARSITNFKEEESLFVGKTVDRPYFSRATIQDLTLGTATYTASAVTATSDQLTVNKWKAAAHNFTKDQEKQVLRFPDMVNQMIDDGAWKLNQYVDRTVFAEYENAAYSTTEAIYTKTDIYDGLGEAHKTLRAAGVEQSRPWYMVVDPYVTQLIQNSNAARETALGDKKVSMGFGYNTTYAGFEVFESPQALTWTGNINIATNPSEGDTVVIDGVTFTFNATPSGAGSVDIGGTAAASVDNLVKLINDPLTTTSTGIALSASDAAKFVDASSTALISAVDNTTSIALTSIKGRITLAETFTAAGDNVSDCILHCIGGQMGNIDTVFQSDMETTVQTKSGSLSTDYITDVMWGVKTFNEGTLRMIDFKVKTQADTATA